MIIEKKVFQVNGESYFTLTTISLVEVIHYFNYDFSLLIIEYNKSICNKKNWNKIRIQTNDKIEILTIVGGG